MECDVCKKMLSSKTNMLRHRRTVHVDAPMPGGDGEEEEAVGTHAWDRR
jgi:hypothetical protein